MNRIIIFLVFILSGLLILCITPVVAENENPLVLIVIPSVGYDKESLTALQEKAIDYGIPYQIVTLSQNDSDIKDHSVNNSISLSEIDDNYVIRPEISLVILGGEGYQELINNSSLGSFIQSWAENGHLIGAIGEGPAILAKFGILNNITSTVKPEEDLISILSTGNALYIDKPGVITKNIITARESNNSEGFSDSLYRRTILRDTIAKYGTLYLGDLNDALSQYIIPQENLNGKVSLIQNNSVYNGWQGAPVIKNNENTQISIPTGIGDWRLTYSSGSNTSLLKKIGSDETIPYGTLQNIKTGLLGNLRDFTTVSGNFDDLLSPTFFNDILLISKAVTPSVQSTIDWYIENQGDSANFYNEWKKLNADRQMTNSTKKK